VPNAGRYALRTSAERRLPHRPEFAGCVWCLLFVLIRHGLRGGSGPGGLFSTVSGGLFSL